MQLLLDTLEERKDQIKMIFDVMRAFQLCKNYITHKLEKIKGMTDTFVKTDTGFKVTAPEGLLQFLEVKRSSWLIVLGFP